MGREKVLEDRQQGLEVEVERLTSRSRSTYWRNFTSRRAPRATRPRQNTQRSFPYKEPAAAGVSSLERKGMTHLLGCSEVYQLVLHCLERDEVGLQVDSHARLEGGRRGEVSVPFSLSGVERRYPLRVLPAFSYLAAPPPGTCVAASECF